MNVRHRVVSALVLVMCLALALPPDVAAQAAQSAGKITTVVPVVNVIRGPQQVAASTSQQVFWGDVINTGHLARARIALDDGSILNVGSDSNLAIAKHDAAQQQTDLDLNYGRVRAKAAKLVKPDAHFQIRTSVGVAGVVGTDMVVIFDASGKMNVVCIEGACKVCDNAGHCVLMKGGQQSSVRSNEQPSQPVQATPMNMSEAVNTTATSGAGAAGGGIGVATGVAVGVGAAVATTVAIVVVRVVTKTQTCSTPTTTGVHANCTKIDGVGKMNGQRVP
ncbi:MAG TPA: FecR family protein [Candidatus Acidoferrales bacterium]|nr:FecR family protein [Candidatus Acidoferrales bacterium]